MVRLEPLVEANFRFGRTDAMFYNPQRVIFGTDGKGTPFEVWVSGNKKFMLCGKTYEDKEATRRILDWTTTTACLNAFLNMKTILVLEKNTLVLRKEGMEHNLYTTDIQDVYNRLLAMSGNEPG